MQHATFTKLDRYELKYHISYADIDRLSDFLAPYCQLDEYSCKSEDGFYWVTSLYLDSPMYTFFRWKEAGLESRFNMRIRTYGECPAVDGPRFFEVKAKRGDTVVKTRGTLLGGHAERLWTDTDAVLSKAKPKDRANLEKFFRLSTSYNAEPKILTQYRRKAWFGVHEDYARVTVDMGLRWRREEGFDFTIHPFDMQVSDLPDYFRPGTNVILELKCPKREVPWWMIDLIRYLELPRGSFSKYGAAMREMHRLPLLRNCNDSIIPATSGRFYA